ncbi:hypothetical protein, partial [Cupriavidus sp.]|uniref:hypothetical protein n=1 Tax=Cupriavidus sp. TaxID=1873897 RepID=UPI003D0BEC67
GPARTNRAKPPELNNERNKRRPPATQCEASPPRDAKRAVKVYQAVWGAFFAYFFGKTKK